MAWKSSPPRTGLFREEEHISGMQAEGYGDHNNGVMSHLPLAMHNGKLCSAERSLQERAFSYGQGSVEPSRCRGCRMMVPFLGFSPMVYPLSWFLSVLDSVWRRLRSGVKLPILVVYFIWF